MTPFKSPNLFIQKLNKDFYVIVNTWHPSSLRIINEKQFEILKAIDGKKTTSDIATAFALESKVVQSMFDSLLRSELIRFDSNFSTIKLTDEPKTLNLWIHTTNKCNLACSYCYISTLNTSGGMTEEVKDRLIDKLVEAVYKRKLESVKLRLAGGEPLTQFRNYKEFIIKAKTVFNQLDCDFQVSFLTNLTILNDEIIELAKKYDIQFGISIDGVGSYNDTTRKFHNNKGSFEIIDRNIDTLLNNDLKLSVSTVVTNGNMEGLPALTEYLIKKKIHFRYSIVKGEFIDRNILSKFLSESYDIMEREIESGWKFSRYYRFNDLKPSELGFQTCSSGFSGGAIYNDGGVYYCHVQFGSKLGLNGTIFEEERDIVDIIKSGSYHEGLKSDDCKSCNYKHVCTSGCPMYRENGKDPNCGLYHQFIPRIYELLGKERLKLILDNAGFN